MPKSKPKIKTTAPTETVKDIKADVMAAIKSGEVTMKPKACFILGSILLGGGIAIAAGLTLLFIGALIFHLRTQNPIGFLRYGSLGGSVFFHLFPWEALTLSVLGIWGGLTLLKKYDISYKRSFVGISFAFVGALIVFALLLDRIGVGDRLERSKPLAPLYRQKFIQDNIVMGEVISATRSGLIIRDPHTGQEVTVVWDESTLLPRGSEFEIGDHVGAIGVFKDNTFYARGIHEGGMRWQNNRPMIDEDNYKSMPMLRRKNIR